MTDERQFESIAKDKQKEKPQTKKDKKKKNDWSEILREEANSKKKLKIVGITIC